MRRSDGRYVFFADTFPSEQNDPGSGHKLTLAPSSESQARIEDPMGKQFKPLAQFQEKVLLDYISPCRRYGLMRRSAPAKGKVGELGGIVSTYYLVDLFSGNHRVLIEDAVAIGSSVIDYAIFTPGIRRWKLTKEKTEGALADFRSYVAANGGCKCKQFFGIQ